MFIQLSFGCRQTVRITPYTAKKDSVSNSDVSLNDRGIVTSTKSSQDIKNVTIVRGKFSNEKYTVYIKTIYEMPDKPEEDSSSYRQGNFLYFVNNKTKNKDSIQLSDDPEGFVNITDASGLLGGSFPLFKISWIGDSDMGVNQYWVFKESSLQMIFEIEDLVELKRVDQYTLRGVVMDRDELVSNTEEYPVTVSLRDYEVKIEKPANQEIGYSTIVLSQFTAHKISDSKAYQLKPGMEIKIDSINRKMNTVRIITKDSTILSVPFSAIKGNVQENAAG
jgi:ribosomal 50S subunit-recycling heat shock protein